jgi:hypothetical protein
MIITIIGSGGNLGYIKAVDGDGTFARVYLHKIDTGCFGSDFGMKIVSRDIQYGPDGIIDFETLPQIFKNLFLLQIDTISSFTNQEILEYIYSCFEKKETNTITCVPTIFTNVHEYVYQLVVILLARRDELQLLYSNELSQVWIDNITIIPYT